MSKKKTPIYSRNAAKASRKRKRESGLVPYLRYVKQAWKAELDALIKRKKEEITNIDKE